MLECTIMSAVRCPIVDGGTQWMVLSAAINNPEVASCQGGTHRGLLRLAVIEALSEVSVPNMHLRYTMAGYLEPPKVPLHS